IAPGFRRWRQRRPLLFHRDHLKGRRRSPPPIRRFVLRPLFPEPGLAPDLESAKPGRDPGWAFERPEPSFSVAVLPAPHILERPEQLGVESPAVPAATKSYARQVEPNESDPGLVRPEVVSHSVVAARPPLARPLMPHQSHPVAPPQPLHSGPLALRG